MDKKHLADAVRRQLAGDTHSDHIALVRAFEGWTRARADGGVRCGWDYARRHFLSGNTLELMSDMRRQFAELLHAIGFLPDGARTADHVDASHNRHARDVSMLRAVMCAGMYPRLVSIRKRGKRNELATHEDGKVECHPGSVNSVFGTNFPFPWLVYGEKVKTSGVYVRDSTCVPAYAALLLGGDFETDAEVADPDSSTKNPDSSTEPDVGIKICGGNYTFSAPRNVLTLIRGLRRELDRLLDAKSRDPGLDLERSGSAKVVDALRTLLAEEERVAYGGGSQADTWRRGSEFGDGDSRGGGYTYGGGRGGGSFGRGRGGGNSRGVSDWECPGGCGWVFGHKRRCFRCGVPRDGGGDGFVGGHRDGPGHTRF